MPDDKPVQYYWDTGWCCHLCDEDLASVSVLDHMRLIHPDLGVEPERWPDGGIVVEEDVDTVADI